MDVYASVFEKVQGECDLVCVQVGGIPKLKLVCCLFVFFLVTVVHPLLLNPEA